VCVLTHDTKFDVPAVLGALSTGVGYIVRWVRAARTPAMGAVAGAGADEGNFARVS